MIDQDLLRDAVAALVQRLVAFVPNLLAALVLLLAGWIVATLLASATRRVAIRTGLEKLVHRSGIDRAFGASAREHPFSHALSRFVFWVFMLTFVVLAISRLGVDLSLLPVQTLLAFAPRVLVAVALLIAGALLARLVAPAAAAAGAGFGVEVQRGLGEAVRSLLLIATGILALAQLGLDVGLLAGALTNLLTIITAGLVLTFALAGRGVASNLLAGYYARETVALEDRLVVDGQEGVLEVIGPICSEMRTEEGRVVFPNTRLVESTVRVYDGASAVGDEGA